jgi:propanol-preferring alcohol dehydrogenase
MLCLRKLNIVGSIVGTLKDVKEALEFTARRLVHVSQIYKHSKVHADEVQQPILTKGKLSDLNHYCRLMIQGMLEAINAWGTNDKPTVWW